MSLPFHAGSRRSSQLIGFLPPTSLFSRSVFETKPKMPVYQPVQLPFASLNSALRAAAFGERYASRRPCLPSGSWNSLEPPTKISAFGLAFSAVMRVWSSPAEKANPKADIFVGRSEEHTSELQSRLHLVCRLL